MNRRSISRRVLGVVALSLTVLTACGASAPPAAELADEMIDTMYFGLDRDKDADQILRIRTCMHEQVAEFSLTDEQAQRYRDLDDVAAKADEGDEAALQVLADFEAALASCN